MNDQAHEGYKHVVNGGRPVSKDVTLTIANPFRPPTFQHTVSLNHTNTVLLHYLEQACIQNNANFKDFTVTFHHQFGYFINALNGVSGNYDVDQSYWRITNDNGALQLGVSSYVPVAGDTITFTLCTGSSCP